MLLEVRQQGCLRVNYEAGDCDVLNAHPGLGRTTDLPGDPEAHYRQHLDAVLQPINLLPFPFYIKSCCWPDSLKGSQVTLPNTQFYGGKKKRTPQNS